MPRDLSEGESRHGVRVVERDNDAVVRAHPGRTSRKTTGAARARIAVAPLHRVELEITTSNARGNRTGAQAEPLWRSVRLWNLNAECGRRARHHAAIFCGLFLRLTRPQV